MDSIDNEDELLWFIEHSGLFRMEIIAEAKRYLYGNREIIKEDIKHERNKRKKTGHEASTKPVKDDKISPK